MSADGAHCLWSWFYEPTLAFQMHVAEGCFLEFLHFTYSVTMYINSSLHFEVHVLYYFQFMLLYTSTPVQFTRNIVVFMPLHLIE